MRNIERQIEDYLSYCENIRNFTKQTMTSKKYILRWLAQATDKDDVCDITINDINIWRMSMVQSGISQRTINMRLAHTIALMRYMSEIGETLSMNVNMIHMAKTNPTRPLFYDYDTINRVLNNCIDGREVMLISIAFEAGLRLTELISLKYEDFTGQRIDVIGKGRKHRVTYITQETRDNLDLYMADYGLEQGYIFPTRCNRWTRPDGRCNMSVDTARMIMRKAFIRAGVTDFHPHALRHSFATTMLKNGAKLPAVQSLLGHSNIATTGQYLHYLDDELLKSHIKSMRPVDIRVLTKSVMFDKVVV